MNVLIAIETVLLVLFAILLVGLLRSYAEVLRRLSKLEQAAPPSGDSHAAEVVPVSAASSAEHLPAPREAQTPAHDIVGESLDGDPVKVSVSAENTLLAFLSSGCLTCQGFWEETRTHGAPTLPGNARLVIVVKNTAFESPSRLRQLSTGHIPLVMSTRAWEDYEVKEYPYFIYVDRSTASVQSEGTASSWRQVASLLADAIGDVEMAERRGKRRRRLPEAASSRERP